MTEQVPVFIVNHERGICDSIAHALDDRNYLIRSYATAHRFFADAALDLPGCVIADVKMPEFNGVDLLNRLNELESPLAVVVVSEKADVPSVVALMASGAVTILELPYNHSDLLHAVELGTESSRLRWQQIQNRRLVRQCLATLTEEEHAVMVQLIAGQPNKAIANTLHLSMRTVDRRKCSVLEKMQVGSVPELAAMLGASEYALSKEGSYGSSRLN